MAVPVWRHVVSELLWADGRTLRNHFSGGLQRRIGSCGEDALRLCSIAFGSGLKSPSVRPRVGRMLRAAWDCVREGYYIWYGGILCAVRELGSTLVALTTYGRFDGTVASRESQHRFAADGEGEVSYDAQLVGNVREADDGKVCVAGDELLVIRAAASALANDGAAAATAQTNHPCTTGIPNAGITDHSYVIPAHEMLLCGSHYRNLVTAPGHAWVAYTLENSRSGVGNGSGPRR